MRLFPANSNRDIRREAGEVLGFLQFYAAWHFTREEQLIAKLNYTAATGKKAALARFWNCSGCFMANRNLPGNMILFAGRQTQDQGRTFLRRAFDADAAILPTHERFRNG